MGTLGIIITTVIITVIITVFIILLLICCIPYEGEKPDDVEKPDYQKELEMALDNEDYEQAALIRDIINRPHN